MNKDLQEKYQKFSSEKLAAVLTSEIDKFQDEARRIAKEILTERGHETDLKKLFLTKFTAYSDEDLVTMAQSENKGNYPPIALEVVLEILDERGYEIEQREIIEYAEPESDSSFLPLILGGIFLIINFFMAQAIYSYNVTGIGSGILIDYIRSVGIFHDVIFRVIIVGIIVSYRQKQKGDYLALWVIAGLLFGAWVLVLVGIIELLTSYPVEED